VATRWLKNFDDKFIRFDTTHERDKRTDRQTPHDDIGRACTASHGKNDDKNTADLQALRCLLIRRYISMYALVELQTSPASE